MLDAQRLAALSVQRVLDGSTLPAALAKFAPPEEGSPGRRRALVQELAYGTLRHWGRLDALVRALATKPIADSSLHLDLISDMKRINSLFCSIAYPILDEAGVLAPSRLREQIAQAVHESQQPVPTEVAAK